MVWCKDEQCDQDMVRYEMVHQYCMYITAAFCREDELAGLWHVCVGEDKCIRDFGGETEV